jgi:protein TonB
MPDASPREKLRNGALRATVPLVSLATAGVSSASYDDPMSKVLGLDERTSGALAWFGFTSGSTVLLAGLMVLTSVVAWLHTVHGRLAVTPDEIDVMREEAPPPPPPPEQEAKPEPAAPAPHHAREAVPPPPAPAQAAKVLAQEPDPNEPVDLTGNTIVQGNADSYAGGFTSANGSNKNAVRAMPAATGVPGGTGPVRETAPSGPDRSRKLALGADGEWNCPFPEEANLEQIDEARVTLQITVGADGAPTSVNVVSEPGNGFGREAKRCALGKRFSPALDHDGNPTSATSKVTIHFTR